MLKCRYCKQEKSLPDGTSCQECRNSQKSRRATVKADRISRGLCWACGIMAPDPGRVKCRGCIAKRRGNNKSEIERLVEQTYAAYGGFKCVCCGETEPMFLTLDHINGGGTKHREELRNGQPAAGGSWLYRELRRAGFPPGYQVLCFNCNCGRARNGGVCPHHSRSGKTPIETLSLLQNASEDVGELAGVRLVMGVVPQAVDELMDGDRQ